jgi:putative ABC transport system permease protein
MSIPKWRRYLRFWGSDLDADVSDEFKFHLETEIDDLVARGMTPADARADALRRFGDVAYYREYCRRADARRTARERRANTFDVLTQDVRYSLRSLLRQPGFTAVAVLTLGLGIGANTAIFSVLNGVILSPLPYKDPNRLVLLWESMRDAPQIMVSYPDYVDWRARTRSFEDIAIYNGYDSFNATGHGDAERIRGGLGSGNLFSVLGVQAARGRVFGPADDRPDAPPVAVITDKLWRNRYSGDPSTVGRQVMLDGVSYTIVGVLPPTMTLAGSQIWLPLGRFTHLPRFARENHPGLLGLGRLKPGVTLEQMRADLTAVMNQLGREHEETENIGAGGTYLNDIIVGQIKPALLMLAGAVGLVLLVACANVANLLLGRAAARHKEFGLRVAIGAGRGRLIRQLLTESTVLALGGGALGVALAWAGVKLLLALQPSNVPRLSFISVSAPVFLFAMAISVLTGVLFGLVPALQATRSDPINALKEGSRASSGGRARMRARATLTVAEVGLALMLLVGAGLMLRSFVNLLSVDPGFDKRNVVAAFIQLPDKRYPQEAQRRAVFHEVRTKVLALPGVREASLATDLPIATSLQTTFEHEGGIPTPTKTEPLLSAATVSPGFFSSVRVKLMAGRDFSDIDRKGQPPVVIVSKSIAKRFYGDESAIGRRIRVRSTPQSEPWMTIVGIVGDVKNDGLQRKTSGQVYFPIGQTDLKSAWVIVRTNAAPDAVGPQLRRVVASIDRDLPVASLQTLERAVDVTIAQPKFSLVMLGIFASIALVLAAIGIYGVISYSVAQRTREIGVRIALGAQRRDVLRMIVGQGMTLSAIGVAAGGLGAIASGRVIAKHLFGVKPSDPAVFAAVAATLLMIAFVASVVPALRATHIDPVEAMRRE